MNDCVYLKTTDKATGTNDCFDHPSYQYFCNNRRKEIIPCISCKPDKCKKYESTNKRRNKR